MDRLAYSESDLDDLGILSRKTRYRLRRDGRFPQPVSAGQKNLYHAKQVHEWLEDPDRWAEENGNGG